MFPVLTLFLALAGQVSAKAPDVRSVDRIELVEAAHHIQDPVVRIDATRMKGGWRVRYRCEQSRRCSPASQRGIAFDLRRERAGVVDDIVARLTAGEASAVNMPSNVLAAVLTVRLHGLRGMQEFRDRTLEGSLLDRLSAALAPPSERGTAN